MRRLSLLLIPAGLGIEGVAVAAFIGGWPISADFYGLLAGHFIASVLLVAGLYLALPRVYQAPRHGAFAFLASSALFVPLIGPLGLVLSLWPGLYSAHRESRRDWDTLDIPDLPFRPVHVDSNDVFVRDGLSSVLLHFDDRNRRQQAILACRHLPRREAVPILRSGLSDPTDEVRSLAHAMIHAIERDLEGQLSVVRDAMADAGDEHGEWHEQRAQLFWEFSYLQLVHDSVEDSMLEKALAAIETAIQREPTAQRWLLRARICLELNRYDDAESALARACSLGLEDDDSAPRWAELAYRRGHFDDVAPALRLMSARAGSNPVMRPILEYWL